MIEETQHLVKGALLADRRMKRKIRLTTRINPVGSDVAPYWTVTNEYTGNVTTIREDRLLGKRYTIVGGIAAGTQ